MGNDYNSGLFDTGYGHTQRERFDLSLNQNLGRYGSITATGSVQNYRDGSPNDTQFQLGYSKFLSNGINMSIAVTRQWTGSDTQTKNIETATSISLSIPLMPESARSVSLSTSYNHSDSAGDQYQVSANGSLNDEANSSYSLSTSSDSGMKFNNLSGSLQRQLGNMQVGLSASTGQGYWQASGNIQGALVLHSGGLTFGPYLGNTFALIEAKGAEGTKISGGYRNVIDSHGYALIPSLVPYHNNSILLNSDNLSGNTELIDNQKYAVPVAGAGVKVVFRTRRGYALLINTTSENGKVIPLGSEVYDLKSNLLGIAGQGGQIYVRVPDTAGILKVKWGDDKPPCRIHYNLNNNHTQQALINIQASCMLPATEKVS